MAKIKISACYIVRNNAADLKRSINSLNKFVDEIIVVDTGSVDDTVAVAKSFGAKIFNSEWQDDFSTPRNIALSKATGDWIIFLDADEYFTDDTAKNILFVINRAEHFKKLALLVYLVNIDVDDGNKILGMNYVLRIFKNSGDLHYVGKIHEELRAGDSLLTETVYVPPNILTLYHTGYSAKINRAKAERNLKMLLAELESTNEPQRIYGYLAECYQGLEDIANAEKFAKLDIEAGSKFTRSYRIILSILANDIDRLNERFNFAVKAVDVFENIPEFYAELAECYAAQGNYQLAVLTMEQALQKFQNYKDSEPTIFNAEIAKFAANRMRFWITKFQP